MDLALPVINPLGSGRGGLRVRQIGWKLQIGLCSPEQECRLFPGGPKYAALRRADHM